MKNNRVLVIEDDPDFIDGLKISLEFHGLSVMTAYDGIEGIKKAEAFQPNCIILDIMLPARGGDLVFCELKNNPITAPIPIIVVTSLLHLEGHPGVEKLMQRKDVAAYFEKPVNPTLLIEKVKALIGITETEYYHG